MMRGFGLDPRPLHFSRHSVAQRVTQPMAQTALLFPGQGSQAVGMGQALVERYPIAAADLRRGRCDPGVPALRALLSGTSRHADRDPERPARHPHREHRGAARLARRAPRPACADRGGRTQHGRVQRARSGGSGELRRRCASDARPWRADGDGRPAASGQHGRRFAAGGRAGRGHLRAGCRRIGRCGAGGELQLARPGRDFGRTGGRSRRGRSGQDGRRTRHPAGGQHRRAFGPDDPGRRGVRRTRRGDAVHAAADHGHRQRARRPRWPPPKRSARSWSAN